MSNDKITKIFAILNPLLYVFVFLWFVYEFIIKFLNITGISDWYFVLFKIKDETTYEVTKLYYDKRYKFNIVKRKAYEYGYNKLLKYKGLDKNIL